MSRPATTPGGFQNFFCFVLDSVFPFRYFLASERPSGHSGAVDLPRRSRADSSVAGSSSPLESHAALSPPVPRLELAQRRRPAQGHGRSEPAPEVGSPRSDPAAAPKNRPVNGLRNRPAAPRTTTRFPVEGSLQALQPVRVEPLQEGVRRPRCSGSSCSATTIWDIAIAWARTSNTWRGTVRAGCWLVCCSAQRPGRRRRATGGLAGVPSSAPAICTWSPTTHASWSCPGSGCRIWPAISWDSGRALVGRLAAEIRASDLLGGELRGTPTLRGHLLSGRRVGGGGAHHRAHPQRPSFPNPSASQSHLSQGAGWRTSAGGSRHERQALGGPGGFLAPNAGRLARPADRRQCPLCDGGHRLERLLGLFHPVPFFSVLPENPAAGQGAEQRPEPVPGRANPL